MEKSLCLGEEVRFFSLLVEENYIAREQINHSKLLLLNNASGMEHMELRLAHFLSEPDEQFSAQKLSSLRDVFAYIFDNE